ncbi:hypothetical protein BD779DRAFT_1473930 [Infundibulicybe gibba]|nr:hypothetical protein BD779DRAFT_1473930 [Infundibulicybe gibba]
MYELWWSDDVTDDRRAAAPSRLSILPLAAGHEVRTCWSILYLLSNKDAFSNKTLPGSAYKSRWGERGERETLKSGRMGVDLRVITRSLLPAQVLIAQIGLGSAGAGRYSVALAQPTSADIRQVLNELTSLILCIGQTIPQSYPKRARVLGRRKAAYKGASEAENR